MMLNKNYPALKTTCLKNCAMFGLTLGLLVLGLASTRVANSAPAPSVSPWNRTTMVNDGCGQVNFVQPAGSPINVGTDPHLLVSADFNLDGKPDLFAVDNTLSQGIGYGIVLLGQGNGAFTPVGSPINVGEQPSALVVADFNLDHKPDVAIASSVFSGAVTVLLGNGNGAFIVGAPQSLGFSPAAMAAGDFNLDGKPDLALTLNNQRVMVLLGNGNGGFSKVYDPNILVAVFPYSAAVGDLNLDGKPDLVVADFISSGAVSVLLGNGQGYFLPPSFYLIGGQDPTSVLIADLNQDGKPDIATLNIDDVRVLLGNGSGSFPAGPGSSFATSGISQDFAAGDFNKDGKLDLAVLKFIPGSVEVLLGNGDGGFSLSPGAPFAVGDDPRQIVTADFNLDGKSDVATVNQLSHDVAILLNTYSATCSPVISCPGNITVSNDPGQCSATVPFSVTATGFPDPTVTCKLGSTIINSPLVFPIGSHIVTCTATNGATPDASCEFRVTVNSTQPATLAYASPQTTGAGRPLTINPVAGPSGLNGIASVSVLDKGSFTGGISVNQNGGQSGVISITNAKPIGSHLIKIALKDGCNTATVASFTLNVTCNSTFTVNDLGDAADASPGDGICATAGNTCTLRAAIQEANASDCAPYTINFSVAGVVNLTAALPNLAASMTINGPGADQLTVRRASGGEYRIFTIEAAFLNIAIAGLTIRDGRVNGNGGGISSFSPLTLTDCVITANEAVSTPSDGSGGGVFLTGLGGMFTGCTFSNNRSDNGAAGVHFENGGVLSLEMINCTVSGNTAKLSGVGGVLNITYSLTSQLQMTNCTVSGNTGAGGSSAGGLAAATLGGNAIVALRNTIIAGNSAPNLKALAASGGTAQINSLGHNLASDGGGGFLTQATDLLNANPLLASLGNYGGATLTQALLPGSPAINAGDNSVTGPTLNLLTDQRGVARQHQATVDIGAFESQGFTLAILGGNNQSTAVGAAFPNSLVVNVGSNFGEPVQGGAVKFIAPGAGATATLVSAPATINANSRASVTAIANNQAGNYQVMASASGAEAVSFNLTNLCALSFTTSTINPSCLGGGQITLNATGGTGALLYSINGGQTFQSTNIFSNLPAGIYNLVVKDSASACMATGVETLIAPPAITLSPATLPLGTPGVPFTQTFTIAGGTGALTIALDGALPAGFDFNPATGTLTGTPQQMGNINFTLTVTDQNRCQLTRSYTLATACPTVTLTPATLPGGMVGAPYNQTIATTPEVNGYSFAVTGGALPAGLTLNARGLLGGTPTQSGAFNFTITAAGFGSCSSSRTYQMVISCGEVTVAPASLPGGAVGRLYDKGVSATPPGNYDFVVTNGALPPGLSLNASTGALTGTPTQPGSFNFRITASLGGCTGFRDYTLVIDCTGALTLGAISNGTAGIGYSQTINVTPAGNYTFSLAQGNLPSGLTLHPTTGVISGLPAVTGTSNFIVKAQMPNGCSGTQSYALTIACPTVTLWALPTPNLNQTYNQTVSASPAGGNYSFAVSSGSLPPGLSLNSASGAVNGTVTQSGAYAFTITATGFGSCAGSRAYNFALSGICPTINLPDLQNGAVGQLYNQSAAASPGGNYTYSVSGNLPPGVQFYGAFGMLYGYPTTAGVYYFTVTAINANDCSGSRQYALPIGGASFNKAAFGDFDGDGKTDFTVWRGKSGNWLTINSGDGNLKVSSWGAGNEPFNDLIVPGDYDGDGKADLAVFRRTAQQNGGEWRIKRSQDNMIITEQWGLATDTPVPGDYDGDGKTDIAVWRGSDGHWYIRQSSDGQTKTVFWGAAIAPYRDLAVPADYDGDGKTDVAVFRQGNGHWYIKFSSNGAVIDKLWGLGTDVPVPGDYDGDGKSDLAVWRGADTNWYVLRSSDGATQSVSWGTIALGDVPVPGDYDGDGQTDVAVWRPASQSWFIKCSGDGAALSKLLGQATDVPINARLR